MSRYIQWILPKYKNCTWLEVYYFDIDNHLTALLTAFYFYCLMTYKTIHVKHKQKNIFFQLAKILFVLSVLSLAYSVIFICHNLWFSKYFPKLLISKLLSIRDAIYKMLYKHKIFLIIFLYESLATLYFLLTF